MLVFLWLESLLRWTAYLRVLLCDALRLLLRWDDFRDGLATAARTVDSLLSASWLPGRWDSDDGPQKCWAVPEYKGLRRSQQRAGSCSDMVWMARNVLYAPAAQ